MDYSTPNYRPPSIPTRANPQAGQNVNQIGSQSQDLYRGNLQTDFQGRYDAQNAQNFNSYQNDSDADVRQAQNLTSILSQARAGLNHGVDGAAISAQLAAVKARIGLKNALGQGIAGNEAAERSAEGEIRAEANNALTSGIKNTRENFNNRGMLYSGMRQGGEGAVRSGVAANMGAGLANTKRDYGNLKDQQKLAYAAVGQAQEAARIQSANQAFDTVSRNNIARQQAYQQLGEGLGRAAGTMYSAQGAAPQSTPSKGGYSDSYKEDGMRNHSFISPDGY